MVDTEFVEALASGPDSRWRRGLGLAGGRLRRRWLPWWATSPWARRSTPMSRADAGRARRAGRHAGAPAVAHRRGRSRLRTPLPLTGCPKDTDAERAAQNAALQKALVGACEVPLRSWPAACRSSSPACSWPGTARCWLSDAGAGAVLAKAALMAASLNVVINIGSMDDVERADVYRNQDGGTFSPQGAPWPMRCTPMS